MKADIDVPSIRRMRARWVETDAVNVSDFQAFPAIVEPLRDAVLADVEAMGEQIAGDPVVSVSDSASDLFIRNKAAIIVEVPVLLTPRQEVTERLRNAKALRSSMDLLSWSVHISRALWARDSLLYGPEEKPQAEGKLNGEESGGNEGDDVKHGGEV